MGKPCRKAVCFGVGEMNLKQKSIIVLSILFSIFSQFCPTPSANAAIISSTIPFQSGERLFATIPPLGKGVGAKVGTFSYSHGFSDFQSFRFRGWVDLAGGVISPSSPRLLIAPHGTLPFDISIGNPEVVTTSLLINNIPVGGSNSVDERQSLWVPFSGTDGARVASFINNDPEGRIDVWFFSDSETDFWFPQSTVTNDGVDANFSPILVEVPYSATFELITVPEPSAIISFALLFLVLIFFRRFYKSRRSCAL
jgi:hypothetical protein